MASTRSTRWGQVNDALVTAMRARAGYRGPDSLRDGVTVFDSVEVRQGTDGSHLWVTFGWSGESADEATPAGEINLASGPMAATVRPRDETGTIYCRAVAQSGDRDVSLLRADCLAILDDVAEVCRADPSLGLDTSGTVGGIRTRAWVTAGDIYQYMRGGVVVDWRFSVTYQTRV